MTSAPWRELLSRAALALRLPEAEVLLAWGYDPTLADRLTGRVPYHLSTASLRENADELDVPLDVLQLLLVRPVRFFFHESLTRGKRNRCPHCKQTFKDGEEVIRREEWYYHPECYRIKNGVLADAEHTPVVSAWIARGRVIKKGGGL